MLGALQMQDSELSILLTGDNQIRLLNGLYAGKNRPTDVLAFAQREGELADRAGRLLGDVVVSVETARRQAGARGADLTSELTMLLAHGLLHLLGWDHDTLPRDRRMRRETARLCEAAEASCAGDTGRRASRARRAPIKGTTSQHAKRDTTPRKRSPRPR
jgi:probable rRNA maturation factor